jgi:thiol-disulfide isomerase/thioredoxin
MRLLVAAAVSLSIGLFIACAHDAKDRSAKIDAMKKKFDTELAELKDRFEKSTSAAEKKEIQAEARELAIITAQKALELAKDDPKDAAAFDAALFVIEKAGRYGAAKELEAAATIIGEHHVNNPKVKDVMPAIAGAGPAGQKFLQAAAEKATDKDVKAVALYFLGTIEAGKLEDEEDAKKVDEVIAKATEFFEKAAKESPEAKIGTKTVAKEVAGQMEELKAVKNVAIGKPAPDVESMGLDGKKVKLADYKGKVVLFDIWATWCGPCRAMIPHEREMVTKMKDKPFMLVSFSADDKKETLEKFLEKEPMPWTHWWDNGPESPVLKKFRVRAFPTLYLMDHSGIIRHKWVGKPENEDLDKAVDALVKEAIKAKG